jgi:hypothetical protein
MTPEILPDWRYLLRHKVTGKYIYLDSNGNLAYSDDPIALTFTPDGWEKKLINFERDIDKGGLVSSFSTTLNFVMDGATILRKISLGLSLETEVELVIQKKTLNIISPDEHEWDYVDFYIGELNFATLEGDELGIKCPLFDGGVFKYVKANESTEYQIPFDNSISVKMDGAQLFDTANFIVTPLVIPNNQPPHLVPAAMTTRDGSAPGFAGFQVADTILDNVQTSDKYLFATSQAITGMHIKGDILFQFNQTPARANGVVRIYLLSNIRNGSNPTNVVAYLTPNGVNGMPVTNENNTLHIFFDLTFNAAANEKFFIVTGEQNVGAITHMEYFDSSFTISWGSTYKTTFIRAKKPFVLFQELTEKITGSSSNCQSTLLNTYSNIALTCGDAIRGLPNPVLKTTLQDFRTFAKVIFCAGSGIENNKITIEELSHFFDVSSPENLGESKNFKWTFAQDYLFNKLKIGYNFKQTDDVNGKYAFNNAFLWITLLTQISKELDLICPYSADPFYIEITRENLDGKTTTDNEADNDIMILNVEPFTDVFTDDAEATAEFSSKRFTFQSMDNFNRFSIGNVFTVTGSTTNNGTYTPISIQVSGNGFIVVVQESLTSNLAESLTFTMTNYKLKRVAYTSNELSSTGVPDLASLFNVDFLTPKQILNRWKRYINSCLFQFAGEDLTFSSTDKNQSLAFSDGTTTIDEDAPVVIDSDRMFKAIYLTFDTEVPDQIPADIAANPNIGFLTTWLGNQYKGILFKGAIAPNSEAAQTFKLLLAPHQDEKRLIY